MVRKLLLALVAPLLIVSACAEPADDAVVLETEGGAALARLQAAPDALAEAGSGRMALTMTFAGGGESYEIVATGAFSGQRATFEMDLGALLAGELGAGGSLPEGMADPMAVVVDGTSTYLKIPMLSMLTGTDGWLSVTPEDMGVAEESLGLGFGTSGNPTQLLETLRGVSGEIDEVGREVVRDVETTRYRVVVDLAAAAEAVPDELRDAYEQQMAGLELGELPLDVWIGDDGLVRRMAVDFADLLGGMDDEALEGLDSGAMVIELFDYGTDIDIELPDPSEVTPFADVMGSFGGLGGDAALG